MMRNADMLYMQQMRSLFNDTSVFFQQYNYSSGIELNAVQRANPEMQKRAYNVIRALGEEDSNPVVSIHDHGSAGHVNCLSELVEECGGLIYTEDRL